MEDECKEAARWLVEEHLDGGVPLEQLPEPYDGAAGGCLSKLTTMRQPVTETTACANDVSASKQFRRRPPASASLTPGRDCSSALSVEVVGCSQE
jgi:hypothetical protein